MDSAPPSDGDTLFVAKQPSYLPVISSGSTQLALTLGLHGCVSYIDGWLAGCIGIDEFSKYFFMLYRIGEAVTCQHHSRECQPAAGHAVKLGYFHHKFLQPSPAQPSPAQATQRVVVKFWRELSGDCDMSWHTCWGHRAVYCLHLYF